MDTSFALFRQLDRTRTNWVLKARVVRMWEVHAFGARSGRPGEVVAFDMLLLDEEGVAIVATLKKRWADRFSPYLAEGGLYIIKNCIVKEAKPTYRVADNNFALTLMHSTSIKTFPTEDFKVPFHIFDFLPFDQLHQRVGSLAKLTDVIGRLRSATELEFVGSDGTVKRRVIRIEDASQNQIDIALLGKQADLLTAGDLATAPILIVTSTVLKTWNGFMSISSTTATKLYRDLDIPETQTLALTSSTSVTIGTLRPRSSSTLNYETLVANRRTLTELTAYCLGGSEEEAVFYCHAIVADFLFEKDWNYPACEAHNRMVFSVDNKFYCSDCGGEPNKTSLRYRLEVQVTDEEDEEGAAIFTLFDKEARKLLNIRADELALAVPDVLDSTCMPQQMKDILGLRLLFCIKVTKFNFRAFNGTYTVLRTYSGDEIPSAPVLSGQPNEPVGVGSSHAVDQAVFPAPPVLTTSHSSTAAHDSPAQNFSMAVPVGAPRPRSSSTLSYETLVGNRRTLAELAAYCLGGSEEEAVFYCHASVTGFLFEDDWNYPACEAHNRMVFSVDNNFFCSDCGGEPNKTSLRYRVKVQVTDDEGAAIFTLFDKEARKLLNIRADELALAVPDGLDSNCMPQQMKEIIGLRLLFCIKVTKFNFRALNNTYTVLKTYSGNEIPSAPVQLFGQPSEPVGVESAHFIDPEASPAPPVVTTSHSPTAAHYSPAKKRRGAGS